MKSNLRIIPIAFSAIFAIHSLESATVLGAVYDNFNDNSINPAKWTADRKIGPLGINFVEQSARLELLNTSGDLDQSTIFHDSLINPRYDQSWQVMVDAYMLVDVNTEPSARIGLSVFSPALTRVTGIALKADDGERRLQGYDGDGFGPDFWPGPPSGLANNGQFIVSYSPTTHLISLGFTNGIGVGSPVTYGTLGIDGLAVGTLGTENWGMSATSQFTISLLGTTADTPVSSGQAYFDNLVTSVLPGDHNLDGKVDAADYVTWRKNPSGHGGTPGGYNIWRVNFGSFPGSGSLAREVAGVPEPTTIISVAILVFTSIAMRRQQRFRSR